MNPINNIIPNMMTMPMNQISLNVNNIDKELKEADFKNLIYSKTKVTINSVRFFEDLTNEKNKMKKARIFLNSEADSKKIIDLMNFSTVNAKEIIINEIKPKSERINSNTIFFSDLDFNKGQEYIDFFNKFGQVSYFELKTNFEGDYNGKGLINFLLNDSQQLKNIIINIKQQNTKCTIEEFSNDITSLNKFSLYLKNFPAEWNTNSESIEQNLLKLLKDIKIVRKCITETLQKTYYCILSFENEEDMDKSKNILNDNVKNLYINKLQNKFDRKVEKNNRNLDMTTLKTVFIRNLKDTTTEEDIKNACQKYGNILSIHLYQKEQNLGYVNFNTHDECLNLLKQRLYDKELSNLLKTKDFITDSITLSFNKNSRKKITNLKNSSKKLKELEKVLQNMPLDNLRMGNPNFKKEKIYNLDFIKNNKDLFLKKPKTEQNNILGKLVYPVVEKLCTNKDLVPKISGIFIDEEILKLDEIIELIENKDKAISLIEEAMDIINENNN